MAPPAASTPRGTAPTSSAYAPASSSPITASVIKFRCLYTHDLRRKSKRWQDGYLRYHAFNKRVMVYDETGNYIGDHHWRSNDEVQDGDEMELDKGALIQVGERMGTTQTDLSNLFEKRKSSQGSPQANDHAFQTPRASAPIRSSGSSQPFRSLNELLGIKKTPIGHLVSPYEESHPPKPASNVPESFERAPKRQKVSSQKGLTIDKAPINTRNIPPQVVDLTEQEDEPVVTRAPSVAQGQKPRREKHRETALPEKDVGQMGRPSSVIGYQNVPGLSNLAGSDTPTFARPVLPMPDSLRSNPPKPAPPAAPSDVRNEQLEAQRTAIIATNKTPRQASRESPREAARPQQDLGQKPQTLPVNKPRKAPESPNLTRPDPPTFVKPALPPSSEAYKSQHLRAQPSAAPKDGRTEHSESRKAASDDVPLTDKSKPDSSRARVNTLRMATEKPRRKLMYSALLPGDASQKPGPGLSSSSPASRSQPIIKPAETQTATAPQEFESPGAEFMPSDSTQFILEEMIDVSSPEVGPVREITNSGSGQHLSLPRKVPAKRALDAPFRKSISDPTVLTTLQTRPTLTRSALSAVPEQQTPVEQGPWTSEALDLFDFWPPGRPKPSSGG